MHSDYFVYNTVVRYFIDRNLTRRRGISFFYFAAKLFGPISLFSLWNCVYFYSS